MSQPNLTGLVVKHLRLWMQKNGVRGGNHKTQRTKKYRRAKLDKQGQRAQQK